MKMKLKTKLALTSSMVVLGVLGVSEWIGFQQTNQFVFAHETMMAAGMSHATALAELRHGGQVLLSRLATLHLFHGILTVAVLLLALNMIWNRTVLQPLAQLLQHINYMRRGNWNKPIPVRARDEIGELTEAFNHLGGQLTLTVHQFASTSKLSGMVLLGHSLVRKTKAASDLVRASLQSAGSPEEDVGNAANRARLELALKLLDEIPPSFEQEFQRQLSLQKQCDKGPSGALPGRPGAHTLSRWRGSRA